MIDENKKRKIELNLDYKIKKIDNINVSKDIPRRIKW